MRELFSHHPHYQVVAKIIRKLNEHKFIAYIAGGAVRDALLGIKAHDIDIATNARPDDVEKLFAKTIDIGKQFGIIMLPSETDTGEKFQVEIATFRADGAYIDGRRPESVEFTTAEGDAERRDFTVNALFYDLEKNQVLDYVDGLEDLKKRTIKAVGDAHKRFSEDKLRLLRAVRFSAQLQFTIEDKTKKALKELAPQIKVVSRERITAELEKMALTRGIVEGFAELHTCGLFGAIFSKVQFANHKASWQLFLKACGRLTGVGSLDLILSTLVILEQNYTNKPCTPQVLNEMFESLVLSRASRNRIEHLVGAMSQFAHDPEDALILLNAEDGPLISEFGFVLTTLGLFTPNLIGDTLDRFLKLADANGQLPKPFVTGQDLKGSVIAGPAFGEALRETYKKQLRGEFKDKPEAVAYALRLANQLT